MSNHEDPRCPTDSSCELCSGTGSVDADTICVCCKKRLKTEEAEAHRYGFRQDPVPSDQFGDYCDHCIETLVVNGLVEDMIQEANV